MKTAILAIDQGTTGSKALVVDELGRVVSRAYSEFTQHYPTPGHVEHDAAEIWRVTLDVARQAIAAAPHHDIAGIGITNQRETAVLWDRRTGQPIHRAIVWQDRRTADMCRTMKQQGLEPWIRARTGLVLDPYFSGTKVRWLLDNVDGARARAEAGELAFGTIDTWLVWNLTGGRIHATDPSNASRTLFFNIDRLEWDDELLEAFGVPRAILPEVRPSSGDYGQSDASLFGRCIPIGGIAGDQQAALFGQGCVTVGTAKNTYGTGAFLLLNTGPTRVESSTGLITTVGCGPRGEPNYALEGSIFIAGAAVQWLRDGLGLIARADETEAMAASLVSNDGVYFVPAFVGLGAPHWNPDARGTMVGLTRGSSRAHLARAALEAMAYGTHDVLSAMITDSRIEARDLAVDGGASGNNWLMQFQADILGLPVRRPANIETTAFGAAGLAGIAAGIWDDCHAFLAAREGETVFTPTMERADRMQHVEGWNRAVRATLAWPGDT